MLLRRVCRISIQNGSNFPFGCGMVPWRRASVPHASGRLTIGRAILAIANLYKQPLFTHAGQVAARYADVR